MAKKKTTDTEAKATPTSVFDALIEQEFTEVKDLAKIDDTVDYWVDSGNWALNYILSKRFRGGYPGGRITNLFGLSGVGKSMFPVIASGAKKWEAPDFDQFDRIVVIDSEGGGNGKGLYQFIGNVDMSKVKYIDTISTLDSYRVSKKDGKQEAVADKDVPAGGKLETNDYIYNRGLLCFLKRLIYGMKYNKSNEKICIIVDSISNIKSFRVAIENGEDMGRTNKLLNNLFGLDNDLHQIGATVLLASKVYTNLNNQYDPWVVSGGQSVIYNPSASLKLTAVQDSDEFSDTELKEEKKRRATSLGNSMKIIRATVSKSRFGTEGRNAWIVLDATYGLVRNSGLFKLLLDFGAIVKNGSRYECPGVIEGSFFKKDFAKIFAEHEQEYIDKLQPIMDKIEDEIRKKRLSINISDLSEFEEEETEEQEAAFEDSVKNMLAEMQAEDEVAADKAREE